MYAITLLVKAISASTLAIVVGAGAAVYYTLTGRWNVAIEIVEDVADFVLDVDGELSKCIGE